MNLLVKIISAALVLWVGSYLALRIFGVDERPNLNKVLNIIDVQYVVVPEPLASIVGIYDPLVALDEKITGTRVKLATPVKTGSE